jgi:hypothetical protein
VDNRDNIFLVFLHSTHSSVFSINKVFEQYCQDGLGVGVTWLSRNLGYNQMKMGKKLVLACRTNLSMQDKLPQLLLPFLGTTIESLMAGDSMPIIPSTWEGS